MSEDEQSKISRRLGSYFDIVENEIIEDEKKLNELIDSYGQIKENLDSLIERKTVLSKASQLMSTQDLSRSFISNISEKGTQSKLSFLAGVIKADDMVKMRRMIFRVSSGRALSTFWDLEENENVKPNNKKEIIIPKKMFTIFYQHDETDSYLEAKLIKICDLFNASRFNLPVPEELPSILANINSDLKDKGLFLSQAENSIKNFLFEKAGFMNNPGKYMIYRLYFKKQRLIYINLNKCIVRENFIDGEIWIPETNYPLLQKVLNDIMNQNENTITASLMDPIHESNSTPPTFIHTNDFLWAFQEIVNTYGIPRYREINPTYFNIITFPFLFGVMFGDIGHGFLLFLFAVYLCLGAQSIQNSDSFLKHLLKARYLLLFMGFFALYCGALYNDFFSIPIGIFGSCYVNQGDIAVKKDNCVYAFGMDPKWYVASNELTFFNSLKMKTSVILGVSHMLFGIVLRGLNSLYFKDYADIICIFIPQFIFMSILFGYMDVMIFIKWATDWTGREGSAPSLVTLLMNIFLGLGTVVYNNIYLYRVINLYGEENLEVVIHKSIST